MKRFWMLGVVAAALAVVGCAEQKKSDCCGKGDGCCKEEQKEKKSSSTGAGDSKSASASKSEVKYAEFGDKMKLTDKETIELDQVLASPDKYNEKVIRVSGTVKEVCQHKGCWINMADKSGKTCFVKFVCPISGRLVPLDAPGKACIVEGKLVVEEVSEDEARHIAEESGKSDEEIRKIVGPQKRVRMASPAVKVAGVEGAKAVY